MGDILPTPSSCVAKLRMPCYTCTESPDLKRDLLGTTCQQALTTFSTNVRNPQSCDWGNITWGHLTSSDGLRWTQPNPEPVFKPDQAYDKEGVFTGCLWPYAPSGGAGLTVLWPCLCDIDRWRKDLAQG
ncbi:hypothetical protein KCU67_g40, partial [Aureobasidium melanogenum]